MPEEDRIQDDIAIDSIALEENEAKWSNIVERQKKGVPGLDDELQRVQVSRPFVHSLFAIAAVRM